jgi:hypothetical protein
MDYQMVETFDEWLQRGITLGYCSEQFCGTHDQAPLHSSEEEDIENGGDPCCHFVRLGSPDDWDIS